MRILLITFFLMILSACGGIRVPFEYTDIIVSSDDINTKIKNGIINIAYPNGKVEKPSNCSQAFAHYLATYNIPADSTEVPNRFPVGPVEPSAYADGVTGCESVKTKEWLDSNVLVDGSFVTLATFTSDDLDTKQKRCADQAEEVSLEDFKVNIKENDLTLSRVPDIRVFSDQYGRITEEQLKDYGYNRNHRNLLMDIRGIGRSTTGEVTTDLEEYNIEDFAVRSYRTQDFVLSTKDLPLEVDSDKNELLLPTGRLVIDFSGAIKVDISVSSALSCRQ